MESLVTCNMLPEYASPKHEYRNNNLQPHSHINDKFIDMVMILCDMIL